MHLSSKYEHSYRHTSIAPVTLPTPQRTPGVGAGDLGGGGKPWRFGRFGGNVAITKPMCVLLPDSQPLSMTSKSGWLNKSDVESRVTY